MNGICYDMVLQELMQLRKSIIPHKKINEQLEEKWLYMDVVIIQASNVLCHHGNQKFETYILVFFERSKYVFVNVRLIHDHVPIDSIRIFTHRVVRFLKANIPVIIRHCLEI